MKKVKKDRGIALDFLILLAVVGVLLVAALVLLRLFGMPVARHETRRIEYTLVVEGEERGGHAYIHEGDRVIDRTNRKMLGTVKSVSVAEHQKEVFRESEGRLILCRVPEREDIHIVIEADTSAPYTLANKPLSVGTTLVFRTRDYSGSGTVLKIKK